MSKSKRFILNQGGIKIALTYKKPVTEKTALKFASLLFWVTSEGQKTSKHLAKATITR